jgi:colanic acid/amylovoran biosynthesis protein
MPHGDDEIRIGLIGAGFETGNMGVGALAAGALRCIHSHWPGSDVYILDYARTPSLTTLLLDGKKIDVPLLNIRFSKKVSLANNIALLLVLALTLRLIPSRKVRGLLLAKNTTLRKIFETDSFASIAGGDSFSDIYGLRRFLYIALPQILVIVAGRKLILLPQTFGPFRSRLSRLLARFIVTNSQSIFTRDRKSIVEVDRLRGKPCRGPKPEFRYDVGFALQPVAPSIVKTSDKFDTSSDRVVGLNVSGLLYMGGYDRNNMFGLRIDYRELIMGILDLLIETRGASVLLVPHVYGGEQNSESDVVACETVYRTVEGKYGSRIGVLRGIYNQGEIKHVIGTTDFFIGSRMHACIAAVSQCVPAVAIAYSDKFIGVMESVGIPSVVVDARQLSLDEVLARIATQYDSRATLRMELREAIPGVIRSAVDLFGDRSQQLENYTCASSMVECATTSNP